VRCTRKFKKVVHCLLSLYVMILCTSNLSSQNKEQQVLLDVEIDKTVYYTDEKLFLLIRIENLSDEVLQIVPVMGLKNEAEHDHCPSVQSLTSGQVYPIKQHPWRISWELKPGEITYHDETFFLEYRHPEVILAPLPAGDYALELELHVTGSNNSSFTVKKRLDFTVKPIDENLPLNTIVRSQTMKQYYERRKMKLDTSFWNAEIRRLLDSSEAAPYRNTIICTYFNVSSDPNIGPQAALNEIQRSIDVALKKPDDLLPLVLLRYGHKDKQYNHLYCERFSEVAATGDTRLHRYFREFVCKQR
jgi:hypothetical protein